MARKKKSPSASSKEHVPVERRLLPHKIIPMAALAPTCALSVELEKLKEIGSLLWFPEGVSVKEQNAKLTKAADLFESIKPGDGVEAMLAMQMVGVHSAAIECLRRAMIPEQTHEGRNASLNQAQRMTNLYLQQVSTLAKYRGKGQQKIIVEHVEVAAGGQAIVGDVHTANLAEPPKRQQPGALEASREDFVSVSAPTTRIKAEQ